MYYFVVNPAARTGHGMEVWNEVHPELESRNIPYRLFCSAAKGDVTKLVRSITETCPPDEADGLLRLVIVGGDGTLNEAFQGVKDFSKVLLGYIPPVRRTTLPSTLASPKSRWKRSCRFSIAKRPRGSTSDT